MPFPPRWVYRGSNYASMNVSDMNGMSPAGTQNGWSSGTALGEGRGTRLMRGNCILRELDRITPQHDEARVVSETCRCSAARPGHGLMSRAPADPPADAPVSRH